MSPREESTRHSGRVPSEGEPLEETISKNPKLSE